MAYRYDGFWACHGHVQGQDDLRHHALARRNAVGRMEATSDARGAAVTARAHPSSGLRPPRAADPALPGRALRRHRDRLRRNRAAPRRALSGPSASTGSCSARRRCARPKRGRAPTGSSIGCAHKEVVIKDFRNSFFPFIGAQIKEFFEELKAQVTPDLVLTHYRGDLHQDHRLIVRADVEHVSRPPHPRVRDPEVRRRPRGAQRVRPARAGALRGQGHEHPRVLPEPAATSRGSRARHSWR